MGNEDQGDGMNVHRKQTPRDYCSSYHLMSVLSSVWCDVIARRYVTGSSLNFVRFMTQLKRMYHYNIPSGTCQDDGQFCNIKTRKCEYECGKISYPYTKIKGNLANVGAKIIVGCINDINNQQTIVECNDVGKWTTLPSCDEFQCPMIKTPYFLSRDLHIIISKQPKSQQEAKHECDFKGGNLVRFDEVNKARQIRNILQNCTDFQSSDYWVDGKRTEGGDDFYFSNGKTMLMDVGIYWAENTPNGYGEQCTRMDDSFDFLLNDKECNDRMGVVCEIPKIHERNGATQHGLP
ncbi:hypothetical protein ACF0H5_010339 [Mactra antiquata]